MDSSWVRDVAGDCSADRARRAAGADLSVGFPTPAGIAGIEWRHDLDACTKRYELGELFVYAECVRYAIGDIRELTRRFGNETGYVARHVLARRQHVRERDDLDRAGASAFGQPLGNR